jgi:hypothetical protein
MVLLACYRIVSLTSSLTDGLLQQVKNKRCVLLTQRRFVVTMKPTIQPLRAKKATNVPPRCIHSLFAGETSRNSSAPNLAADGRFKNIHHDVRSNVSTALI